MSNYELLLSCYKSGQISEQQWAQHLKDEVFIKWLYKTERFAR